MGVVKKFATETFVSNKIETEKKIAELQAKYEEESKETASLADSRIDIAINYIMKKVVSSW